MDCHQLSFPGDEMEMRWQILELRSLQRRSEALQLQEPAAA